MSRRCPKLVYAPAPCPRCGATTYTQAETICQPSFDETGEAYCPTRDQPDDNDVIMQPTPESLAIYDEWIERRYVETLG